MICVPFAQLRSQGWHGGRTKFEARIKELVDASDLAILVEPLLIVRRSFANRLASCIAVAVIVRDDDVAAPDDGAGVGPVVALTYRATVDVPPGSGTPSGRGVFG